MRFAKQQRPRPGRAERPEARAVRQPLPHQRLHCRERRPANPILQPVENTTPKMAPCATPALQPIENKGRKKAFYSRAPRIEVYENKGQSAILIAAQTHVFVPREPAAPTSLQLSPCDFQPFFPAPNRNTPRTEIVELHENKRGVLC